MSLKNGLLATILAGSTLLAAGCASAPSEVRIQGVAVSAGCADRDQAQACLQLSKKLWDRDALESLRYLRKGAELRDSECCRQYLAHSESPAANLSQRVYARLFVEGLLRKGPLPTLS